MGDISQVLEQVSVERIRGHIAAMEGVRHPVAAPEALARGAGYIRDTLAALGYAVADHLFEDGEGTFGNVIGSRSGTRYPERRILVLAHFDTVADSPGADDNASGVALLLELAAILKGLPLERTIHFIGVNLEECAGEDGGGCALRGSTALAEFARERGWQIDAVVVLESVGYAGGWARQSAPEGMPVAVPEAGDFIAAVGNEGSRRLVQEFVRVVERHRIALPCFPVVVPGNGEIFPDTRRSDHAPFWDRGFPALMLTDTTNLRSPHYHQPSDTLDTLNLPFAAAVCRAACALLVELAGLTAPP